MSGRPCGQRARKQDWDPAWRKWCRALVALTAVSATLFLHPASAQPSSLVGDWFLTLNERRATHTGVLTFELSDGHLEAFVDGGPAELALADGTLEVTFDTRDGGGQLLHYTLRGSAAGNELMGELDPPLDAPLGTWHAKRQAAPTPQPPRPVARPPAALGAVGRGLY